MNPPWRSPVSRSGIYLVGAALVVLAAWLLHTRGIAPPIQQRIAERKAPPAAGTPPIPAHAGTTPPTVPSATLAGKTQARDLPKASVAAPAFESPLVREAHAQAALKKEAKRREVLTLLQKAQQTRAPTMEERHSVSPPAPSCEELLVTYDRAVKALEFAYDDYARHYNDNDVELTNFLRETWENTSERGLKGALLQIWITAPCQLLHVVELARREPDAWWMRDLANVLLKSGSPEGFEVVKARLLASSDPKFREEVLGRFGSSILPARDERFLPLLRDLARSAPEPKLREQALGMLPPWDEENKPLARSLLLDPAESIAVRRTAARIACPDPVKDAVASAQSLRAYASMGLAPDLPPTLRACVAWQIQHFVEQQPKPHPFDGHGFTSDSPVFAVAFDALEGLVANDPDHGVRESAREAAVEVKRRQAKLRYDEAMKDPEIEQHFLEFLWALKQQMEEDKKANPNAPPEPFPPPERYRNIPPGMLAPHPKAVVAEERLGREVEEYQRHLDALHPPAP